jgi:hypothetical protein
MKIILIVFLFLSASLVSAQSREKVIPITPIKITEVKAMPRVDSITRQDVESIPEKPIVREVIGLSVVTYYDNTGNTKTYSREDIERTPNANCFLNSLLIK